VFKFKFKKNSFFLGAKDTKWSFLVPDFFEASEEWQVVFFVRIAISYGVVRRDEDPVRTD